MLTYDEPLLSLSLKFFELILCEVPPHNRDKHLKAVWWEEHVSEKPTEAESAIKIE